MQKYNNFSGFDYTPFFLKISPKVSWRAEAGDLVSLNFGLITDLKNTKTPIEMATKLYDNPIEMIKLSVLFNRSLSHGFIFFIGIR